MELFLRHSNLSGNYQNNGMEDRNSFFGPTAVFRFVFYDMRFPHPESQ